MLPEEDTRKEYLHQNFEALSISRRLMRSVSQKWRRNNRKGGSEEEDSPRGLSLRCLTLYGKVGGCKVGAETGEEIGDPSCRRRSSAGEEGKETRVDCFTNGVKERLWRKQSQKEFELMDTIRNSDVHFFLPDDILELCLLRLPFTCLMNARLVCKKWRDLTTTPRFLQMRREGSYLSPWLFLFGAVKDGYCSGEIHALELSQNKWHKVDANILKGKFMFSVASIGDYIYVVGGCSSLTNFGKLDRSSFKTHKGVLVFSPVNKSWHRAASMKHARSLPILGISEVNPEFSVFQSHQSRQDRRLPRSRVRGASEVYEDPHRLSIRCSNRNSFDENEASSSCRMSSKFTRQRSGQSSMKGCRRFVLIAVGGLGCWDEPLDSGEIYDSVLNKWAEIPRLPVDLGVVCSGIVCNRLFYAYSENNKLAGYDIENGFWILIQTTPFPPRVHEYYPKLVSCNGRLFMLCVSWCEGDGQIGQRNKAVRKLWELDLACLVWTEVSVHPDAPMDWNAAFVGDQNLIFGVEMFKIFGQVLDFVTIYDVSDVATKWNHVSRTRLTQELDASSCNTKTMAVLHL